MGLQGGVGWGTFVSVDNIKRSTYAHGGGVLYGLESFNNKRVCGHSIASISSWLVLAPDKTNIFLYKPDHSDTLKKY